LLGILVIGFVNRVVAAVVWLGFGKSVGCAVYGIGRSAVLCGGLGNQGLSFGDSLHASSDQRGLTFWGVAEGSEVAFVDAPVGFDGVELAVRVGDDSGRIGYSGIGLGVAGCQRGASLVEVSGGGVRGGGCVAVPGVGSG
jgi:hypothetical protein